MKIFYNPTDGVYTSVTNTPINEDDIVVPPRPPEKSTYNPDTNSWTIDPVEPVPEPPIVIPAVTFWERTTETEGTAIEAMLNQQPFRIRQIFMTAQSYRSDHELWPLLQSAAVQLFGDARASELLSPP